MIPLAVSPREYILFAVLLDENIDRIKAYDPAAVTLSRIPPVEATRGRSLREVVIGYATEAEAEELTKPGADIGKLLRSLSRGLAFRPDLGDHDAAYSPLGRRDD